MIFVSFGNVPIPFIRLAEAVDSLAIRIKEKIIIQYGHTNYPFKNVEAIAFIDHDQLIKYMTDASIVILQGGWGGISEASSLNKKIIAVPRIMGLEHNHDQVQLVRELEEKQNVIGVYEINDLEIKIEMAKNYNFKPIERGSSTEIINIKLNEWFK